MDRKQLTITRVLNAPIEKVWDAWTNPESLKQWKSPEGMTVPEVTIDLVVGGTYRVVMEGHDNSYPNYNGTTVVGGSYMEIEKPTKLVYTWLWEGAPAETHTTTVTIQLKSLDKTKTELVLTHSGFADDNMKVEHDSGWMSTLKKLDQFLSI